VKTLDDIIRDNFPQQIAFLQQLVQTRSANPFTPENSDPDTPIELHVAQLIHNRLQEIGLSPEFRGVSAQRPNVIAVLPGTNSHKSLILNGHMDTVMLGSHWTVDPFGGLIQDHRLYGLGALDMKASLSIFIFAAQAIREAGITLGGDVILTFAVDEEPGGCSPFGTAYLLENGLTGDAAIVAEPENTNIAIGHRGGYRFKLTVHGQAAHTGLLIWERGEQGKNAITSMAQAITTLQNLPVPHQESAAFPGRKPVFTFPTLIQGGTSINTVPDECTAYGDIRLLPGCAASTVENLIRERLDTIPDLDYVLEQLLFVPAVEIPTNHPLVEVLKCQTLDITGQEPTTLGCGPWNDGWMFITHGIPAICGFGPNGGEVHAPDEFVDLGSLLETTRIFAHTLVNYFE